MLWCSNNPMQPTSSNYFYKSSKILQPSKHLTTLLIIFLVTVVSWSNEKIFFIYCESTFQTNRFVSHLQLDSALAHPRENRCCLPFQAQLGFSRLLSQSPSRALPLDAIRCTGCTMIWLLLTMKEQSLKVFPRGKALSLQVTRKLRSWTAGSEHLQTSPVDCRPHRWQPFL